MASRKFIFFVIYFQKINKHRTTYVPERRKGVMERLEERSWLKNSGMANKKKALWRCINRMQKL